MNVNKVYIITIYDKFQHKYILPFGYTTITEAEAEIARIKSLSNETSAYIECIEIKGDNNE